MTKEGSGGSGRAIDAAVSPAGRIDAAKRKATTSAEQDREKGLADLTEIRGDTRNPRQLAWMLAAAKLAFRRRMDIGYASRTHVTEELVDSCLALASRLIDEEGW